MDKLKVIYLGSKYYRDGWLAGIVKINEVLEDNDENFSPGQQFNVRGDAGFEPLRDTEYTLIGELINDKTWGKQIEIYGLTEEIELETEDDKRYFLSQILTENQVNELYKTYDDPFILLQNEDIPSLIKVNGIQETMARKLIARFHSTIDNAPAYVYFKKFDITNNLVNKLVRTYKTPTELIKAFEKNPYILMEDVDGIGFIKADEIALKSGVQKTSPIRIKNGILHLLRSEAEDNGSTWISPSYFRVNIVKLLSIGFDDIKATFKDMVENEILYITEDKKKIALKVNYELERNVANKILQFCKYKPDSYNKEEIDDKINKQEEFQGFTFTEEQREGIHKVIENNIVIISGNAGTGKTTVVKGFLGVLNDNQSVALTSLSGQASKRMSEATGYPASTIHRLLGYIPDLGFTYNASNTLPFDVVILDECSMVSVDLFWNLIRAMRVESKLIILGDDKQLPPIGIGNLFTDLLASDVPKQKLTQIHRQAAKSAIISVSAKVREKKQIVEPNYDNEETLGELQDLTMCVYQNKNVLFDKIIEKYKEEYLANPSIKDIQVVVPMKERGPLSQLELNNKIQELVNPGQHKYVQMGKKYIIKVGDKVINRKNHYKIFDRDYKPAQVFNGSMGIVKEIYDDYMIIDFFDIGELRITSDLYKGIQLAYAITCHSAQGSQWRTTIVGLDYAAYILLSNEWIYTAITRAAKMCYLVAETKALRYGTITTKIKGRDTFLQELLEEGE